jgi:hypothetical protein
VETAVGARHSVLGPTVFLIGLGILYFLFYGLFLAFPYVSPGADIVYRSKLAAEKGGGIFPQGSHKRKILIFGNSTVLAGFIPAVFDRLAAADGLDTVTFNSGYPARSEFVSQLRTMTERGVVPDVVLLTIPWNFPKRDLFHLVTDDHDMAERLFPFRSLPSDLVYFLRASRTRGGPVQFYRQSAEVVEKLLADRGYYFISEQSASADNRLPDDARRPDDDTSRVSLREADPESPVLAELNGILRKHKIDCFYIPSYARNTRLAPAPSVDNAFAQVLERHTQCKLVGPDYLLYRNALFSDFVHLNPDGALTYTTALYNLLQRELERGKNDRAVQ